ncbi:MAG: M23 family metallopeptidase [Anaerovoracaceae bacterium]
MKKKANIAWITVASLSLPALIFICIIYQYELAMKEKLIEKAVGYGNFDLVSSKGFAYPVPKTKPLTSPFGYSPGRSDYHLGVDWGGMTPGFPVKATGDGTVEIAMFLGSYGNCVKLLHSGGMSSRYAHLSAFAVKGGEIVKKGQTVGMIGFSGNCIPAGPAGAHLHFEIIKDGAVQNPINYL